MTYQVLALRWRPKKLSEVIGQGHIVRSLQNALNLNRTGQAYLFTGTRGVGKTSVARIFAKSLRCQNRLPNSDACGECQACQTFNTDSSLDIFEIDGASYNSVDNIREIIAGAQYSPSVGDKKIYIIDEVHMLSTSAFNALLKTLEEPPAHVVFIFATTEIAKVPDTVISRCQRFDFKSASEKDLEDLILKISANEKIKFTSGQTISSIAKMGEGSIRDTLSLLEQVVGYCYSQDKNEIVITPEFASEALGIARKDELDDLLVTILNENSNEAHQRYQSFISKNIAPNMVLQGLIETVGLKIKLMTVEKKTPSEISDSKTSLAEMFWIYEVLVKDFEWATQNNFACEVVDLLLQKICLRRQLRNTAHVAAKTKQEIKSAPVQNANPAPAPAPAPVPRVETAPEITTKVEAETPKASTWDEFIKFLYKKGPASASYLEQGNILAPVEEIDGKLSVKIGFPPSAKIFFEYMTERESNQRLKKNLSEFFKREEKDINVEMKLVSDSPLMSKVQIEEKKIQDGKQERQEQFMNNPMVKMAQELFQSKIDKVVLNQNLE